MIRMLLLQTVPLLLLPVFALTLGAPLFIGPDWTSTLWLASALWCGVVYVVATGLAVGRLTHAEERILGMMAGRGAA